MYHQNVYIFFTNEQLQFYSFTAEIVHFVSISICGIDALGDIIQNWQNSYTIFIMS